ncbi:hypothetical protein IEE91_12885 [Kocuria sp. cx-455]|uniref:hypothetical protein n=1 Tax=Kocuria sp. cx-455 TaxID=2771377 RepID=UPI001688A9F2|nr:hypothetical protein [Kocuria sp. cx-455]MBD2766068.1 hypothetical protein [Kocuria sp. cx-455]
MTDVATQSPQPLHSDRQWNPTLVEFWLYRRSLCTQWLIAHADVLDSQYVIFDDKIWSTHSSRGHWQTYKASGPKAAT